MMFKEREIVCKLVSRGRLDVEVDVWSQALAPRSQVFISLKRSDPRCSFLSRSVNRGRSAIGRSHVFCVLEKVGPRFAGGAVEIASSMVTYR